MQRKDLEHLAEFGGLLAALELAKEAGAHAAQPGRLGLGEAVGPATASDQEAERGWRIDVPVRDKTGARTPPMATFFPDGKVTPS